MNSKIREAQLEKIPYMLIIGDRESAASTVSLRLRNGTDLGSLPLSQFIERVEAIIEARTPRGL
jgi:threonyl-tRNA synthetase